MMDDPDGMASLNPAIHGWRVVTRLLAGLEPTLDVVGLG